MNLNILIIRQHRKDLAGLIADDSLTVLFTANTTSLHVIP
jgi:hypothetical protein